MAILKDVGELGIFTNIDKALVAQDTKTFNETPLQTSRCVTVLTKLLYLLYHGERLTTKEATSVFFAVTKAFQSKDPSLRRLVYVVIKELATTAQDVIMVVSSLIQDMNTLAALRANALRSLGSVIDSTMISGIERHIKQAIGDKNPGVSSAALVTAVHLFAQNREAVRRWLPEIQATLQSANSKTIVQYHALGLLYLLKQHDRMAVAKLVQQMHSQSHNMLATCLFLRIYGQLLAMDGASLMGVGSGSPLDLKPFLRFKGKSDMVALEAARVICSNSDLYGSDVLFAITALQTFLTSGKPLIRFAAIRVLNDLANVAPQKVASCNVDIENLVTDANRNVATLAITTLLKTGNEATVDRLIGQITGYVSEISDEFKVIVVDAVRSLGLKFPSKHRTMLDFLGNVLREEGGQTYKEATLNSIFQLLASIPAAREPALVHLCEFIEDCEYPKLTAQVLHLLGEEGPRTEHPARLIRYIYNRLILEDAPVRVTAVGALCKLAASLDVLKPGVLSILRRCLDDGDDEVRDRAVIGLRMLQAEGEEEEERKREDLGESSPLPKITKAKEIFLSEEIFDPVALQEQLMEYIARSEEGKSTAIMDNSIFDLQRVPKVSKTSLFQRAASATIAGAMNVADFTGVASTAGATGAIISPSHPSHAQGIATGTTSSSHYPSGPSSKFERRIEQMSQFAPFGPLFSSSLPPLALTDPESEYVVVAIKHIFPGNVVLEFECRNTVRELLLENVQMQVTVQSTNNDVSFEPLFALAIPKLPFDQPQSCFVAFAVDSYQHPEALFTCSLSFISRELDLLNVPTGADPSSPLDDAAYVGRGTQEEYAVDSLELALGDYIRYRDLADFDAEWSRLGTRHHNTQTLELPSMRTVAEAVQAVTKLIGIPAYHRTDQVEPKAALHTLLMSGTLLMPMGGGEGADFVLRARFALNPDAAVAVEINVRSTSESVTEAIINALC